MKRQDVMLSVLELGERPFEPVHVQKALFLVDDLAKGVFDRNSRYSFEPYDYGPFDSAVYADLDALAGLGLVVVERDPSYRYRRYTLTKQGHEAGKRALAALTKKQRDTLKRIVAFVQRHSFRQLVSAIYAAYPRMKKKSVFR